MRNGPASPLLLPPEKLCWRYSFFQEIHPISGKISAECGFLVAEIRTTSGLQPSFQQRFDRRDIAQRLEFGRNFELLGEVQAGGFRPLCQWPRRPAGGSCRGRPRTWPGRRPSRFSPGVARGRSIASPCSRGCGPFANRGPHARICQIRRRWTRGPTRTLASTAMSTAA